MNMKIAFVKGFPDISRSTGQCPHCNAEVKWLSSCCPKCEQRIEWPPFPNDATVPTERKTLKFNIPKHWREE